MRRCVLINGVECPQSHFWRTENGIAFSATTLKQVHCISEHVKFKWYSAFGSAITSRKWIKSSIFAKCQGSYPFYGFIKHRDKITGQTVRILCCVAPLSIWHFCQGKQFIICLISKRNFNSHIFPQRSRGLGDTCKLISKSGKATSRK